MTCSKCAIRDRPDRDRNRDSNDYSSSSSSSTPTNTYAGGGGGSFGGAGASGSWSGTASKTSDAQSAASLGAIPLATAAVAANEAAAQASDQNTLLGSAGLTPDDASLFDHVSEFDEKDDNSSAYDS